MDILPYNLETTNDLLTSRAGLISIGHIMNSVRLADLVNKHFSVPKSNRGYKPSTFVNSLVLMLHEGGTCLDDLRHIRDDEALRYLMGLDKVPESDSMGDWLRRHGMDGVRAVTEVNKPLLQLALNNRKSITLDIDATLSASKNKNAEWTYKKCTGYMPMVGHIAETGQVVATDFREGNVSPNTNNFEFIQQCEAALPQGVTLKHLRIDSAGYQVAIIDDCIKREIEFAIRAKMNKTLKQFIEQQSDDKWQPLLDKTGKAVDGEFTCRLVHSMEKSEHAFTAIVQRKEINGQLNLEIDDDASEETVQRGSYIYRAIT